MDGWGCGDQKNCKSVMRWLKRTAHMGDSVIGELHAAVEPVVDGRARGVAGVHEPGQPNRTAVAVAMEGRGGVRADDLIVLLEENGSGPGISHTDLIGS